MSDRPLCVKVQLTDGDMGETVTETVVIHPAEGDDKLQMLNDESKRAVKEATKKMNDKYSPDWRGKPPEWEQTRPPHEVCPRCEGHGGIPGDKCERCEGTGRADKQSNI